MGSSESPPTSWSPYEAYRDCSSGMCSIYCPQWCYIVFSPPLQPSSRYNVSSNTPFPPVMIAVIVILACVFLFVSYYSFVYIYWRRRGSGNAQTDYGVHRDGALPDERQAAACGLEDFVIKSITVFKYRKSDGLVEGTECSVCLSEFEEGENLRLMPKCCHAFHPPCIDTWLKSQSSCPLCRARVNPFSPVTTHSQRSAIINLSSLEVQRDQNELVHVVEDDIQVMEVCVCDDEPKDPVRDAVEMENSEEESRRSISLGTFSCNLEGIGSSEDGVRRCYSNATFDSSLHDRA